MASVPTQRWWRGLLLALMLLASGTGCTRHFYRNRADQEVADILHEKDRFPQWQILNMHVYPDARARFGDPTKPDRPPMPPDDPGAHLLAPNPQKPGHPGIKWIEGTAYLDLLGQWDAENRARKAQEEQEANEKKAAEKEEVRPKKLPPVTRRVRRVEQAQAQAPREVDSDGWAAVGAPPAPKTNSSGIELAQFQQPKTPSADIELAQFQQPKAGQAESLPTPRLDSAPDVPDPRYTPPTGPPDADTDAFILRGQTGVKPFLMTPEQAILLAMINSREYQTRREDLYLAALPVTRERFSFAAQGFFAENFIRERTGALAQAGKGDRAIFQTNTGVGKLFSTGALLLFQFANETVINLNRDLGTTSVSTINLDFIQPLLRGAGRAVTLEPLTQAERNLLYNVRTYARFRKQFYQYITGGGGLPGIGGGGGGGGAGVGTIGIVGGGNVGPSGLSLGGLGASISPGSFPGFTGNLRSLQVNPSGAGTLFLNLSPGAPAEGVYSAVLRAAILDIGLQNVKRLEDALRLFEGFEQGGEVSKLQVDQIRLRLLSGRTNVLNSAQDLRDSLDNVKLQLGVPVTMQIEFADDLVRPIMKHMSRFEELIGDYESTVRMLDNLLSADDAKVLRAGLLQLFAESRLTQPTVKFRAELPRLWRDVQLRYPNLKALVDHITTLREERRKLFDLKFDLEAKEQTLSPADQARLIASDRELNVAELELAVRRYEEQPWLKAPNERVAADIFAARWRDVRNAFTLILSEASNERLDILRPRWPTVPSIEVAGVDVVNADIERAYEAVITTAIENRLDLMNARAQMHDAWRQVRVIANTLLGFFNVAYHMDASTLPTGSRPLAFIPEATRHQLITNVQLPLVRLQERNAYRASLISYQRARRALMEAEDTIVNQVRQEVRQLQVLAKNFKIQQQNVELSFLQVESSLETFRAPLPPGQQGNSAANAASLTQQVTNAYNSVLQAQGQLVNTWVSYITARQQLFIDTELMQIDPRGVWLDEFAQFTNGATHFDRADASGPAAAGAAPGPGVLPPPRQEAP
jgi:outer membrane protein TolC